MCRIECRRRKRLYIVNVDMVDCETFTGSYMETSTDLQNILISEYKYYLYFPRPLPLPLRSHSVPAHDSEMSHIHAWDFLPVVFPSAETAV